MHARARACAQVVFVDTPGVLRRETDLLDSRMNSYVSRALREADVAVCIVDAAEADGLRRRTAGAPPRACPMAMRQAARGGRGNGATHRAGSASYPASATLVAPSLHHVARSVSP